VSCPDRAPPAPARRAWPTRNGLGVADLAGLDRPDSGNAFVQGHLTDVHVVKAMTREGCQRVRRSDQPLQSRVGGDLNAPRSRTDVQPFRQSGHHAHEQRRWHALPMHACAGRFETIPVTGDAWELPWGGPFTRVWPSPTQP
jgi:hypothetical protein